MCAIQFDHIGVVAATLADGREHLSQLLGIGEWTVEVEDPVNAVFVQFGRDPSGICYEVIAPRGEAAPVMRALRRGDRILNHVAYLVSDLGAEQQRLSGLKCVPAGDPNPAVAYDGNRIQFFVSPLRFIIELIEAPRHRHAYASGPVGACMQTDDATSPNDAGEA